MMNILQDLGLSKGEAKVYTTLLKLGPSKAGTIVSNADIAYSKIYIILDKVSKKGLVSYILNDKTKVFSAVDPTRIREFIIEKEEKLQKQKSEFESILPELTKLSTKQGDNSAEVFISLRGIRTAYEILLKNSHPHDILRYFYPFTTVHPTATKFYESWYFSQAPKQLDERGIAPLKFKHTKHYKDIAGKINLRFANFPLPGTMDIFDNKILLVSWDQPTGFLITSLELSNHYKDYFDEIWDLLPS